MPELRFSANAKHDLTQIARFIVRDKPVAARRWVAKIREKCRVVARHPEIGDARPELGEGIRSTYAGSYVIFFRRNDEFIEIVRVIRGDREASTL